MAAQPTRPVGPDISRILFYAIGSIGAVLLIFGAGLYEGSQQTPVYRFVRDTIAAAENALTLVANETPTLVGSRPSHFLQKARYAGDGVTVNAATADQSDLIFLAGFFKDTNELRLMRRNGDIVARWPVRFYDLFHDTSHFPEGFAPTSNWNIDLHGAVALPDGSIVFNFEWGGLVKLDRCGNRVWTINRQTHHSVERAEGGGFLVLARRLVERVSPYEPFEPPYHEDTVLRVSEDGQILSERSLVSLFYRNGLEPLLTASGSTFYRGMDWDREVLHTNKVGELSAELARDFPGFDAGDLVLSFRDHNLVMVTDAAVDRVKWYSVGPWLRQHDPEFRRGGTIALFNNNAYRTAFGDGYADYKAPLSARPVSNVLEIDPRTRQSRVLYGGRPEQEMLSIIKGKIQATARGGFLVTEAQSGRVREIDADGTVLWEYINRYSADEVAELGEGRIYPASYFTVRNWSCP